MRYATLKVDGGDRIGALRGFLSQLLSSDFVQAVLVPKPLADGGGVVQSLITDPQGLSDTLPIAPTMPVQSAQILSELTSTPAEGRIAAVLKPCELRGAIELSKFLQVNLENVLTIGVDCLGTYSVTDYAQMSADERESAIRGLVEAAPENKTAAIRQACQMCRYPSAGSADVCVGLLGASADSIPLMLGDRFADQLADALSLELLDGEPSGRTAAVDALVAQRSDRRKELLDGFAAETGNLDALVQTLSTCIGCHNCMTVCPICYCKECVFDSAVFEHRPDQFLAWAKRKGVLRVPTDTLMFHLTRLSHMGTSCVGCGLCESACPNDIPVSNLFNLIGGKLQETFEYVPGEDAAVDPPVASFKEEELVEVAPNE
jgi:formate dehydrogenase subunit beta